MLVTRQRLAIITKRERAIVDDPQQSDSAKYTQLVELGQHRRRSLQAFNQAYDRAVLSTVHQQDEVLPQHGEALE